MRRGAVAAVRRGAGGAAVAGTRPAAGRCCSTIGPGRCSRGAEAKSDDDQGDPSTDQGAARAHRRRHDGLQEGAGGVGRRRGQGGGAAAEAGIGEGGEEIGPNRGGGGGAELHPRRRPARRPPGGELRDGLRGAERGFPDVRGRHRHARRGDESGVPDGGGDSRGRGDEAAGDLPGAAGRVREEAGDRGEDRRGAGREVEEGDLPPGPALREGRQEDGRTGADGAGGEDRGERDGPPLRALGAGRGSGEAQVRHRRGRAGDAGAVTARVPRPLRRTRGRRAPFRRVVLKLSGEVLAGERGYGLDPAAVRAVCAEIAGVHRLGVGVGVVIGGGNIFRGAQPGETGIDRVAGDQMGMLATVVNALALQCRLEALGIPTRVQTAFSIPSFAEPYIRRRAVRHLEKQRVVIFAGGTGSPYFSTDTAAALRAAEIGADAVLKGTKVDGVYDKDPVRHPDARRFERLTHREALDRGLRVMDATAIALCMENRTPIVVFALGRPGNARRACRGEPVGTLVEDGMREDRPRTSRARGARRRG
ncbi:MAG: UMP kinase [Deltaproteobacteria bacterium]|nr:UMP kinase [Deltaproteobacteria bacterium]